MREFMCTQCGHKFEVALCNGQQGWQISCPQCSSQVRRVNNSGGGQCRNMGQGGLRQGCGQGQGKKSFGSGNGGRGSYSGTGSRRGQGMGKGICRTNIDDSNQIKDTGTSGNKDI